MENSYIKVFHIVGSEQKSGRVAAVLDLHEHLLKADVQSHLVFTSQSWGYDQATNRRLNPIVLKSPTVSGLAKTGKDVSSAIFHYHDSKSYKYIPKKNKHNIKTVVSINGYDYKKKEFPNSKYIKYAHRLIASNNLERNLCRDIPYDVNYIDLIYKSIFLKRFNSSASPQPVLSDLNVPPEISLIGIVSRFDDSLNYELILDTIKLCIENLEDVEFLLVGDGPRREEFEKTIESNGLKGKTLFTGFRDDIVQVFAAIDIYFHPTFYDTITYSVIEAMALGKPIVSPNLSSVREILEDSVNGLFYNIENPDSAFELISRFRNDAQLQSEVRINNIEKAKTDFSLEKAVKKYTRIYKKLLSA